jgi:hypothetical protein
MKKNISLSVIARIISVALLIFALAKNPYGYYTFLRWTVFISSGYSAYIAFSSQKNIWVVIFGIIAILFNPLIPVFLKRDTWAIIHIITACVLLFSTFVIREKS